MIIQRAKRGIITILVRLRTYPVMTLPGLGTHRLVLFAVLAFSMAAPLAVLSSLPAHSESPKSAASPTSAISQSPDHIAGLTELPLMPGFVEQTDRQVIFDKPSGRIIKAFARGQGETGSVREFYDQALNQLGWRAMAVDHFEREDEVLRLAYRELTGGRLEIEFSIAPRR